jgi:hypothetical protein
MIHTQKAVPVDMQVLHSCDNPQCVNPKHLWIGTHEDNMKDMAKKGRRRGKGTGPCPSKGLRGERNPNRKLSEGDVRAIKQRLVKMEPRRRVANRFQVSLSTIDRIVNKSNWAWVYNKDDEPAPPPKKKNK